MASFSVSVSAPANSFSSPDPEAHDFYFRAPEDELDAKPVYRFTVPIFGRGVAYDTSPEIMAEQLGFLFPALREAAMRKFALIMFDETKRFADALGAEGEIDLPHAMNELTVKIASRCLIGQEVRDRVDTGFAEAYHELQNGINTLGFFLPRLPTAAHRNRDRARRESGRAVRRDHGGAPAFRGRSRRFHADAHAGPLQGRPCAERRRDHRHPSDGVVRRPAHQRGARDLDRPGAPPGALLPGAREGRGGGRLPRGGGHEPRQPPATSGAGARGARMRAPAPAADIADPQGSQTACGTAVTSGACRHHGHGVAGGCLTGLPPPVRRPGGGSFRTASPRRLPRTSNITTPLVGFGGGKHACMGKHFAYHAAQGDLDRSARPVRLFFLDTGVSAIRITAAG